MALAFSLATGEEAVTVNVILSASGFDVDPSERPMIVKRQRDPETETATFRLTAHTPGGEAVRRVIHADFFLGNSLIGSVSHATMVVPKGYAGPESAGDTTQDGFTVPARPRQECEWVVIVVGEAPDYRLLVSSSLPGDSYVGREMGTWKMPEKDLAGYLDGILSEEFAKYPNSRLLVPADFAAKVATWRSSFMGTISDLGRQLWQWLPKDFRDEYFALHDAGTLPRSILIHSAEMVFPWEILVPNRVPPKDLDPTKPLGVAHILGRWKPGLVMKPSKQMLEVRSFRVLTPCYPGPDALPWASEEAAELEKMFPGLVKLVSPADLSHVRALLDERDVQVVHFSGHGEVDAAHPGSNKLLLENAEALTALNLAGKALCSVAQPVVYLNACGVGSVGVEVGRAGGFASGFVENGCSGVIAPLWPIGDQRSKDFAIALYRKLESGRAVGEALQELREENDTDPTFGAYTYFGDPWVRLLLT